jgi:hypothetical protein
MFSTRRRDEHDRPGGVPPPDDPRRPTPEDLYSPSAEQHARLIPHAKTSYYEGIGHTSFREDPDRFDAAGGLPDGHRSWMAVAPQAAVLGDQ